MIFWAPFPAAAQSQVLPVEIFSGDRDVFQLIDENTVVFMTKKGISDIERYDIAAIQQRYGVLPSQLIEIKGLMGDSSDNIPRSAWRRGENSYQIDQSIRYYR